MKFVDLLFKRYASPFSLLDSMILVGNFSRFIVAFLKEINEEREEKFTWEFFLHKVDDKSYKDFKESMKVDIKNYTATKSDHVTTKKISAGILSRVDPTKGVSS